MRNEFHANIALESAAAERARVIAVLGPRGVTQRRAVRHPSMLARIVALFA